MVSERDAYFPSDVGQGVEQAVDRGRRVVGVDLDSQQAAVDRHRRVGGRLGVIAAVEQALAGGKCLFDVANTAAAASSSSLSYSFFKYSDSPPAASMSSGTPIARNLAFCFSVNLTFFLIPRELSANAIAPPAVATRWAFL